MQQEHSLHAWHRRCKVDAYVNWKQTNRERTGDCPVDREEKKKRRNVGGSK